MMLYELILTTLRNRSGIYVDNGLCVDHTAAAKELTNEILNKVISFRSKDAYEHFFCTYNIISYIQKKLEQKEAQWGIHEPDNTIKTQKTTKRENWCYSTSPNDFSKISWKIYGTTRRSSRYRTRLRESPKHKG